MVLDKDFEIYIEHKALYEWYIHNKKTIKKLERKTNYYYMFTGKRLFEEGVTLRKLNRERCNEINMNLNLIYDAPSTSQIMSYYIDVLFRYVEVVRSLLDSLEIFTNNKHPFVNINITGSMYYFTSAILKLYGCFEKTGKLMYVLFELNDYQGDRNDLKGKYFEIVVEMSKLEDFNFIEPIKIVSSISSNSIHKKYIKIRDKIIHGIRPECILNENELTLFYLESIDIMFENLKLLHNLLRSLDISIGYMHEKSKLLDKINPKPFLGGDYYLHNNSTFENRK